MSGAYRCCCSIPTCPRTTPPTARSPGSCMGVTTRRISSRRSSSGIAGVRALRAAGISPRVWHINEGHAAFQIVERIRELRSRDWSSMRPSRPSQPARCSRRTRRSPRVMTCSTGTWCSDYFRNLIGELGIGRGIPGSRPDGGRRPAIQHDAPGVDRRAECEWRQPHPWRRHGRDLRVQLARDRRRRESHRFRHQRRARADVHADGMGGPARAEHRPVLAVPADGPGPVRQIQDIPDGRFWYVGQQVKAAMLIGLRDRLRRQHARNRSPMPTSTGC